MKVFISHTQNDKDFVTQLRKSLTEAEIEIWVNDFNIQDGDNIISKIQQGLGDATHLIVVLSKSYVESKWTRTELNSFLSNIINDERGKIFLILVEPCQIPTILRDIVYYDFIKDKDFDQLINNIIDEFGQNQKLIQDIAITKQILDKSKETSRSNQINKIANELKNGNLTVFCGAGISKVKY